jgi:hypothetical protein
MAPYRARRVAARATRQEKEHGVEGELVDRWKAELASIGWPVERLAASIDTAGSKLAAPPKLSLESVRRMFAEVLAADGELARRKVFARRQVLVEVAAHLFGQDARPLDQLVDRALQDPEMILLSASPGPRAALRASVGPGHGAGRRQPSPAKWSEATRLPHGWAPSTTLLPQQSERSAPLCQPNSDTPWRASAHRAVAPNWSWGGRSE